MGTDLARATRQAAERVIDLTLCAYPRRADIGGDRFAPVTSEDGIMRPVGHHVTAVRDTTEALHRLREQGFDVVVSDAGRAGDPQAWDKLDSEIRVRRVKRRFSDDPIPVAVHAVADKAAAIRADFLAAGSSMGWSSRAFSTYTAPRWRLIRVQVKARIRKG